MKKPNLPSIASVAPAVQALEALYQPSDAERRLKASFFAALEDNPVCDRKGVTAAAVELLTNDSGIHRLWGRPRFKEWFTNTSEFAAKCDYVLDQLLDSFEAIALSDDPKSYGAKVSAAKLLADLRGHTSKVAKTRVLDGEIPTDPDKLLEYINTLEKLLPARSIK